MKQHIAIEIDTDRLETLTDERIATLWHVVQANPAPTGDKEAGELAEHIAREIVRRWLSKVRPPLWNHQGRHYYWDILCKHGKWLPLPGEGKDGKREWTPNPLTNTASVSMADHP